MSEKRYVLEVREEEGTENLIVSFPDELMETMGWKEGDVLRWDVGETGVFVKKVGEDPE